MQNNGEWSLLCMLIWKNSGSLKPWQLELKCKVGTGSGQLWRAWMRGERVGRDYNQVNVMKAARAFGWLEGISNSQIASVVDGASVAEVASLAKQDPRLPSPLPYPTEKYRQLPPWALANRSAGLLLRDYHNPLSRQAQLRLLKDEWKDAVGVTGKILGQEYKKCLAAITVIDGPDGASSGNGAKATIAKLKKIAERRSLNATKAILVAAYRRQGDIE